MSHQIRVLKSLKYHGINPFKALKYNKLDRERFGVGLLSHTLDFSFSFESDFAR